MNIQQTIPESKRVINIELLSGRTACISCSTPDVKETKFDNKIVKISYEDKVHFQIEDVLEFKLNSITSKFQIKEFIKNDIQGRYYCTCSLQTYCNYFLLPLITNHPSQNKDWFGIGSFVINSYLSDNFENIILAARYFPDEKFAIWEDKIKLHDNYMGFEDPNNYSVIYKFHIPEQHKEDIKLFIAGKYSKLSEAAKKKILSFHKANKAGELYGILYKTPNKKKALEDKLKMKLSSDIELYSVPNLQDEVWNPQKI